jgi:hypothetical protein
MIQAVDVMRTIIDALSMPLQVRRVEVIGAVQRLHTRNTWYLNTKTTVSIGGNEYLIKGFKQNCYIDVPLTPTVTAGIYQLNKPYYIHGKYEAVNKELANVQPIDYNPLVWYLETDKRRYPSEVDSNLESDGNVRMFVMDSSNWEDFDTIDHYTEIISPLGSLVDHIIETAKFVLGVNDIGGFETVNHAKFTTGGDGVKVSGKKVLGDTQSGIELIMNIPIRKRLYGCDKNC